MKWKEPRGWVLQKREEMEKGNRTQVTMPTPKDRFGVQAERID